MYRYRKHEKEYANVPKEADRGCPFCKPEDRRLNPKERATVEETGYAEVIHNMFGYDHWELRDVVEHLLIIPKRHVTSLADLTKAERADIMDLICKFEGQGYDVYSRAPSSKGRSLAHVHTHLIKTAGKPARLVVASRKPFFLIKL